VRILFVSDGKKQRHAFLSTDLELEPSEILTYYARRWAIEVFFKDAKQMLYMGKEQSNTFDALVASYSMVLIRHLMLVFILPPITGETQVFTCTLHEHSVLLHDVFVGIRITRSHY
jgi:hypothetical protein